MSTEGKQKEPTFFERHAACPFAGQGGSYEVRDGKRVLVERTGVKPEDVAAHNEAADAQRDVATK